MQMTNDELIANDQPWLNSSHPNFVRWERARNLSFERGKFVKSIIEKYLVCENLNILDLGSGEGGTSVILSKKNNLISFDLNLIRLKRQAKKEFSKINGDGLALPFKKISFDLIILQDVIEHVCDPKKLVENLNHLLKEKGIIFLSTPNKFSLFNIISDPHWGFPIVSLLKRKSIKKYFLQFFRKGEITRKDIPQLLSLNELINLFRNNFLVNLNTKHPVEKLLEGNKGIVWSDFHLFLIKIIKSLKLDNQIKKISNDKIGILNKFFTPTFYLIAKKTKLFIH